MNAQEIAATLKGIVAGLSGRKDVDLLYLEQIKANGGRCGVSPMCLFLMRHTKNWHAGTHGSGDNYFAHITSACQSYLGALVWDALDS